MLKKIRVVLAILFWTAITLLFLDFTGTLRHWLGWMAKIQFLPACLALNFGVIIALILLTFIFGRIYCSVICPLGVMQDAISWIHGKTKKKNRFRFHFSKENKWLRYGVLAAFVALIVAGATSIAYIIAPYGAYGRMVENLATPIYKYINNVLAHISEHYESYAFYSKEVWLKSLPTFIISVVMLVTITVLAWTGGRSWCNNICPVGTVLGSISRFSIFAPKINDDKCVGCGLCGKQCKSSCIDTVHHKIDTSRCVDCFDCIGACNSGAITFGPRNPFSACAATKQNEEAANVVGEKKEDEVDSGKRAFMLSTALIAGTAISKAQEFGGDGGLAPLEEKKKPQRETPVVPPGAVSLKHMASKCIGCQLCVSQCPNNVLRPSGSLMTLMQPEMSFERGYCRPECTRCSEVCPTGAILKITKEEKTAIHVGHAVVDNWVCVTSNGEKCGNCARHCPVGAIRMVANEFDPEGPRVPFVDEERCIGCGACEHLCPVRPLSAIHVEGNRVHHDERKDVQAIEENPQENQQ